MIDFTEIQIRGAAAGVENFAYEIKRYFDRLSNCDAILSGLSNARDELNRGIQAAKADMEAARNIESQSQEAARECHNRADRCNDVAMDIYWNGAEGDYWGACNARDNARSAARDYERQASQMVSVRMEAESAINKMYGKISEIDDAKSRLQSAYDYAIKKLNASLSAAERAANKLYSLLNYELGNFTSCKLDSTDELVDLRNRLARAIDELSRNMDHIQASVNSAGSEAEGLEFLDQAASSFSSIHDSLQYGGGKMGDLLKRLDDDIKVLEHYENFTFEGI